MPCGITQCYLPPDRGDIPALTPAEAGTRLSDPKSITDYATPEPLSLTMDVAIAECASNQSQT